MIYMNLRIVSPPKRTDELLHAFRLQMGRTEIQPGCLKCTLSLDTSNPCLILYQEQWNRWEDIEAHIRSDRFAWTLELMECSCNTPDLNFSDTRETRGMEYVRKLRTPESIGEQYL